MTRQQGRERASSTYGTDWRRRNLYPAEQVRSGRTVVSILMWPDISHRLGTTELTRSQQPALLSNESQSDTGEAVSPEMLQWNTLQRGNLNRTKRSKKRECCASCPQRPLNFCRKEGRGGGGECWVDTHREGSKADINKYDVLVLLRGRQLNTQRKCCPNPNTCWM